MADTFSREERSEIMRRVKSKDTALERRVRSALHQRGLRFRLSYPLPGHPDIVFISGRVAVFIDSCFWHGCPQHVRMPRSNVEYWNRKIARNMERDSRTKAAYKRSGWKLMRFWEHELKENFDKCATKIEKAVRARASMFSENPDKKRGEA